MQINKSELYNVYVHEKQFPPTDIPPKKDEPNPDIPPDERLGQ